VMNLWLRVAGKVSAIQVTLVRGDISRGVLPSLINELFARSTYLKRRHLTGPPFLLEEEVP